MYDIPGYPIYKLTKDLKILGKKGQPMTFSKNQAGHKYVTVYNNKRICLLYLHRAVALVHVPGYFEGAWVDHIDDDPTNNEPSNLQWIMPELNCYMNKGSSKAYKDVLLRQLAAYQNKIKSIEDKLSRLHHVI